MIGTMYERLSASQIALASFGVAPSRMAVRGHPEAIRPFALGFCGDRELSKREIAFLENGSIIWRGHFVYQDEQAPKNFVVIEVDRFPVICVRLDALPEIDEQCPAQFQALATMCIRRLTGART